MKTATEVFNEILENLDSQKWETAGDLVKQLREHTEQGHFPDIDLRGKDNRTRILCDALIDYAQDYTPQHMGL
jgi:hypothetical protein